MSNWSAIWALDQDMGSDADAADWRTQLPEGSRQRSVNKITEALKRHLPFSGQEGLQELKKIAVRVEEKAFAAATSQSDYLRKISLKMLTMGTISQNPTASSIQFNAAGNTSQNTNDPASLDSSSHTGNANCGGWREEIFQKIRSMNDMYFPELNEMYQKIAAKLQQHDSLPQQLKKEQLEKLRFIKVMLERIILFLQISKNEVQHYHKEKITGVEKQIINFLNSNRPRNSVSSMPQGQLSQSHLHTLQQPRPPQSQISQMHSNENHMNSQMHPGNEIFQKIRSMNDMYFPELNEMHQKIAAKLQQHDSLPQQPKNDQLEKLKFFKVMLEHLILFLQISKNEVQEKHKEKIIAVEKQIINILNSNRPRKPVSSMPQGQLSQSHLHTLQQPRPPQSQISQMHSNENHMNLQMHPGNAVEP